MLSNVNSGAGFVSGQETTGAADRRSQTVVGKILRAERMIELELEAKGGVYPANDGRLTEAEVCQRAGVLPGTLQSTAHATTTRLQVLAWLRKMQAWIDHGERPQDLGSKADEWKTLLEQIAISYDSANVEVATLRKRMKALKEREDALAEKHANLNATFSRKTGRDPSR